MGYFNFFKNTAYDFEGDGVFSNVVNLTSTTKVNYRTLQSIELYSDILIEDGERPEQLSTRLYGTTEYYWTFILLNSELNNIWNDWPKSQDQLLEYTKAKYVGTVIVAEIESNLGDAVGVNSLTDDATPLKAGDEVTGNTSGARATVREVFPSQKYVIVDMIEGEFRATGEYITRDGSSIFLSEFSGDAAFGPKYYVDNFTGDITNPRAAGTSIISNYEYEAFINNANRTINIIKPERIDEFIAEYRREMT